MQFKLATQQESPVADKSMQQRERTIAQSLENGWRTEVAHHNFQWATKPAKHSSTRVVCLLVASRSCLCNLEVEEMTKKWGLWAGQAHTKKTDDPKRKNGK